MILGSKIAFILIQWRYFSKGLFFLFSFFFFFFFFFLSFIANVYKIWWDMVQMAYCKTWYGTVVWYVVWYENPIPYHHTIPNVLLPL